MAGNEVSVKRVNLMRVVFTRGEGTPKDPCRHVAGYFDDEGTCVAEHDPVHPSPWFGPSPINLTPDTGAAGGGPGVHVQGYVPLEPEQMKHIIEQRLVGRAFQHVMSHVHNGRHHLVLIFEGGVGLMFQPNQAGDTIHTTFLGDVHTPEPPPSE